MPSLEELIDIGDDSHRLLDWDLLDADVTQVF